MLVSPYLRRRLRSLREACLELAAKAGKPPGCGDCAMRAACRRAPSGDDDASAGAAARDAALSAPRS